MEGIKNFAYKNVLRCAELNVYITLSSAHRNEICL